MGFFSEAKCFRESRVLEQRSTNSTYVTRPDISHVLYSHGTLSKVPFFIYFMAVTGISYKGDLHLGLFVFVFIYQSVSCCGLKCWSMVTNVDQCFPKLDITSLQYLVLSITQRCDEGDDSIDRRSSNVH